MGYRTKTDFSHIPIATVATVATFPHEEGQKVAEVATVAGREEGNNLPSDPARC